MKIDSDDLILVDAHVHLHHCFDVASFVEEACLNFSSAAQLFNFGKRYVGVLLLADAYAERSFHRLSCASTQSTASTQAIWNCDLQSTKENASLYLTFGGESDSLVIIAGRQIISQERLEVLALGTRQRFREGQRADKLIQDIAISGALPILPWGVGKWIGKRGRIVKDLLRNPDLPQFFLGDNANRPAFWPQPAHFRLAEERGIRNLPGSDPLPLPGEVKRPGSFGFALRGALNLEKPAQDLKRKLSAPSTSIEFYGRAESLMRFVRNQALMQYRKLFGS